MKNLLEVSNIMFRDREKWIDVTDEEKASFFFIFNRYFSKKYPDMAQSLNTKGIDSTLAMDLWFHFMKGKPYPKWFWSKSEIKKGEEENLHLKLDISVEELEIIKKYFPEELAEELKWIKSAQKIK